MDPYRPEPETLGACIPLQVETFQDKNYLYLMLEAVMGGELFSYLQSRRYPLTEAHARFYTGCVVLALEMLFSKGYVFRDLKPENILINKDGYLKLSDFGFAKKVKVSAIRSHVCPCPARAGAWEAACFPPLNLSRPNAGRPHVHHLRHP